MRRGIAGPNDGDDLQNWFQQIPLVTKTLVTGTLLVGAGTSFGFVAADKLLFVWPLIRYKFQVWRLITPFLFAGPFSFNFAMHAYVLYENCRRYENIAFDTGGGGSSSDFLWMVGISMSVLVIVAYVFDMVVMSESLLYVVMYVWSRRESEARVNIFGFKFQALFLPWVYVAIRMLMGGSITMPLIGIAVGHFYFFLVEVLPHSHGVQVIQTPRICISASSWYTGALSPGLARGAATGGVPQPMGRGRPQGAGYQWGRGQVLGDR